VKLDAPQVVAAPLVVRPFASSDREAWTDFAVRSAQATLFHRIEWLDVMEQVFGHRGRYLVAERGGALAGILPLAQVESLLFGKSLVSLPFCVYGGAVGDDVEAVHALHAAARDLARSLGVSHLEVRNRTATETDWPRQDLYCTFRKSLLPDSDANFRAIPSKRRNMVRRGAKAGLQAQIDGNLDRFYPLYTDNVHRHGTPPVARRYFEAVSRALGADAEVLTVSDAGGRAVSSAFLMYFRDEVSPYYVGDCPDARALAANDFMYWEVMQRAVVRGCRVFDWSRSKKGTGSFEFKKLWGFEPAQLHYEYALVGRDSVPQNNPLNPKYRAMIAVWQRLPRSVVNLVGPHLVRGLG
jgi:FemAB-related protein (PEP-CTERM system-associated)